MARPDLPASFAPASEESTLGQSASARSALAREPLFAAPAGHGEWVVLPASEDPASLLDLNRQQASFHGIDVQGQSLAELVCEARRGLVRSALEFTRAYRDFPPPTHPGAPICMAGHQPELFHAGVWFKNFVLASLTDRHGWLGVNVLIDNDVLQTPAIRVPQGNRAVGATASVAFDRAVEGVPYEERHVSDESLFSQFAARVAKSSQGVLDQPLLHRLWPRVESAYRRTGNLGQGIAEARHRLEGEWGQQSLEVPLSRLCQTAPFLRFAAHLLAQLPRLHATYNRCLWEYRSENRIRSRTHPVPELEAKQEWLEAPFWIWTVERPRREHLFVRRSGVRVLLADLHGLERELSLPENGDAGVAVEQLLAWEASGVRLRPRALITTMYLRLVLCDLFLHGIGGAKYDQLTDRIIASFFSLPAPAYLTVTATLKLFPDRVAELQQAIAHAGSTLREYRYHPERHVAPTPRNLQLGAEKAAWIAQSPPRGQGRSRREAIARLNAQLVEELLGAERQLAERQRRLLVDLRRQQQIGSREFSYCLFREDQARTLLTAMAEAACRG